MSPTIQLQKNSQAGRNPIGTRRGYHGHPAIAQCQLAVDGILLGDQQASRRCPRAITEVPRPDIMAM